MEPMGDGVMNKDDSCRIQSKLSLPVHNQSSFSLLGKRKAINGSVDISCSLVKNYTNFMKSHLPKRILFHENGEWNDFPQGLVDLVIEDFMMKKAVIEVRFNEMNVLLDLVYMVQVELTNGSLKPIAWIDEAGSCYFPELSSLKARVQQLCQNRLERDYGESELNQAQELKLHIEIDVNGLNNRNLEECVEESNVGSKRVKVEQESIGDADESLYKEKIMPKTDLKPHNAAGNDKHTQLAAPAHQFLDVDGIQNLFHMAMKPFINVSLLGVEKFASTMLPMRYELFQKQVEIVDKYRGNSNVRYAWFPCSRDTISNITSYGLWQGGNDQRIKYGSGVHLHAVNNAFQSATYCDVDENGVHQMVFCRVILGNMEVLHPGSQQFHPSCENFDSGVDDLQNPSYYIIWNMNASTCIYPEYVITFQMLSGAQGSVVPEENKLDISGVTSQDPHGQFLISRPSFSKGSSHKYQEAPGTVASRSNSPKSPSMQFSLLFKAIEDKISAEYMNLVYEHYGLFKSKKISRDEFIVKLRTVVGDQLLRSTITSMQGKVPPNNARLLQI